ncbi:MAG: HAMP domain-containing sensor histidine kinase, partial [Actinomycetota bacterium]|nr:HAMP domain-containing sensor histidine kinase [Actinomycetota bacterium]
MRYVSLIVAIVISSGLVLGLVVTLTSVRNAAEERRRSLEYAGSVVAASLIPVIADQDPGLIKAQLKGILDTSEAHSIECIEIIDAAGVVIAETEEGCTCDLVEPSRGLLDEFTKPQAVLVPIEVEGQRLASVRIQFLPVGLEDAVYQPLAVTVVVLFLAMVVAALWGVWTVLRTVVEPIETLRNAAKSIAQGERGVRLSQDRGDEIGELATALDDMTEQLSRQERELLESYRSLEGAFEEKADLARRLERTMEFKSDFVAVASHELRSPLAVIRLYAEMLADNEFGGVDPPLKEAVDSIVSATSRLTAIVSSLMDVALLERGLMPLDYEKTELRGIIEQAVSDFAAIAARRDVSVDFSGESRPVELRGDPIRLRQVIDNLLSNAIKYS